MMGGFSEPSAATLIAAAERDAFYAAIVSISLMLISAALYCYLRNHLLSQHD